MFNPTSCPQVLRDDPRRVLQISIPLRAGSCSGTRSLTDDLTAMGHQDRFLPPRLSGGCRLRSGQLLPTIRPCIHLGPSATCSAIGTYLTFGTVLSSSCPRKRAPRASDVRLPWTPAFAGATSEWELSVWFAPLCAAKHDEGVYRLHSLTRRQHHERTDVQLCQLPSMCTARYDTRTRVSANASRSAAGRPRKP